MRRASGFTLLETVVAMAILALALMAIFDLNAGAVRMHSYTKRLTIASLLARSKMTDLEQKLYDDGMSVDDEEDDGDFSEEGWPSFKWRAKILAPKTDNLPPEQLLSAVFNIPIPGAEGSGDSSGSQDPLSALGGLFGGGAANPAAGAAGAAGGLAAMGPMAGLAQGQFSQLVDQLTKSVREVHLTVYWKEGKEVESIDVVTHVVSTGQGSDRNGSGATGPGSNGPGSNAPIGFVDAVTGAPVPSPIGGKNPATGNPVITFQQWQQLHGGSTSGGGVPGAGPRPPGSPNSLPFGAKIPGQFGMPFRGGGGIR